MNSRRHFLTSMALLMASRAIPSIKLPLNPTENKLKIMILGAGPAGLTTAYELQTAGHEVSVFEARNRVGGRMYTLKEPFDGSLYAEAGALYLVSHNPGLAYAREFGLKLNKIPFRQELGSVVYVKNKRLLDKEGQELSYPFNLAEEDRNKTISQLQGKYHRAHVYGMQDLNEMNDRGFPQQKFLHLDDMSLKEFWKKNGANESTVQLMKLRYYGGYGDKLEEVSALQLFREAAGFLGTEASYQVDGGNDRICRELANRLKNKIRLNSPVLKISQNDSCASLIINDNGKNREVRGDYVVVAAPPQVMKSIDLENGISSKRIRALDTIRGVDVTRTYIQTNRRFWLEEGLDGSAITDLPIQSIYNATIAQESTKGILESMTYASGATFLGKMPYNERIVQVKKYMEMVYPEMAQVSEKYTSYAWGEDPWSLGGHSAFQPGQIGECFKLISKREGRIFFAGDTYGGIPGYSHAAFASGQQVAKAIHLMAN